MKSIPNLLIVAGLVLLCASSLEARSKKRKGYWRNNVHENFEIYHPKGLTVWYPQVRGLVGFGVEVFLNQHASDYSECDVCRNTTNISYGKFIIHDDDAVIRAGDNLRYRFIFQMANGSIYTTQREFHVAANKILRRQEEHPSTTTSSVTEVGPSKIAIYEEDISLLESIIYDVLQHCDNVTEISKNLYFHYKTPANLNSKQLLEYLRNKLESVSPTINWSTVLVNAFYYNDGIGFEVMTLIDKLKILVLAPSFYPVAISDMDDLYQYRESTED
ncbi:uncharacterized protein LOC5572815 [Aedes aegypti]|nr:uncharacterized protein LOC5572815 [Aedes aegypti]